MWRVVICIVFKIKFVLVFLFDVDYLIWLMVNCLFLVSIKIILYGNDCDLLYSIIDIKVCLYFILVFFY